MTRATDEAYALSVRHDAIEIVGGGEAGLYYGVRTLLGIAASPKCPGVPIRGAEIKAWPSLSRRVYHAYFSSFGKNNEKGNSGYEMARSKEMI